MSESNMQKLPQSAQDAHTHRNSAIAEKTVFTKEIVCAEDTASAVSGRTSTEETVPVKVRRSAGRKNSFTEPQIAHMLALLDHGTPITEIARQYHVSRQTIYNQIRRAHRFSSDPNVRMRMYFMNYDELCTTIDIDFLHETIAIQNYTDAIILRAFGIVEHPTWENFEYFLEDRCFPRTRHRVDELLKELGVPFYDPLLIFEKTKGYMAEDHQWILIVKKEG